MFIVYAVHTNERESATEGWRAVGIFTNEDRAIDFGEKYEKENVAVCFVREEEIFIDPNLSIVSDLFTKSVLMQERLKGSRL